MNDSSSTVTKRALILIAEDLDSNFLFLKIVLSKQYNIIWAKNGAEAVELFKKYNPDLVLMDIKMPVMNGLDSTEAIRNISDTVPIIAQTANAFESDHQKARKAGCSDIITKPIKIVHLIDMVKKYLPTEELPKEKKHDQRVKVS
ncbi:MAG: response regulator [Bacteroidales bacterium]